MKQAIKTHIIKVEGIYPQAFPDKFIKSDIIQNIGKQLYERDLLEFHNEPYGVSGTLHKKVTVTLKVLTK